MAPLQRPTLTPHPASLRRRVWPPRHRKIKARGGHTASFPWCVLRQHGGTAGCRVQRPPRQRIIQNRRPRGTRGAANLIPARPGTGSPGLHYTSLSPASRQRPGPNLGAAACRRKAGGSRCIAPPPGPGDWRGPTVADSDEDRRAGPYRRVRPRRPYPLTRCDGAALPCLLGSARPANFGAATPRHTVRRSPPHPLSLISPARRVLHLLFNSERLDEPRPPFQTKHES